MKKDLRRKQHDDEARRLWAALRRGASFKEEAAALERLVNAHPRQDARVVSFLLAKLPVSLDDPARLRMYLSVCDALPRPAGVRKESLARMLCKVTHGLKVGGHGRHLRSLDSAFDTLVRYNGPAALFSLEGFLAPDESVQVWRVALKWICLALTRDVPASDAITPSMLARTDRMVAELADPGRARSLDDDMVLAYACTVRIFADRSRCHEITQRLAEASAGADMYLRIAGLLSIACANWKHSSMLDAVLLHEGMQELERARPKPEQVLDDAV